MLQFIKCDNCGALKLVGVEGRRIEIYPEGGGGILKEPLKRTIVCPDCGNICKIETAAPIKKVKGE